MDARDLPEGFDVLDDLQTLARLDPEDMRGQVARSPAQLRAAWAQTRTLTLPASHRAADAVAVLGMGGSAIGADLVAGIFGARLTVPLLPVREYELPAWVGPHTLVLASSHSGATEETLGAFEQALRRHCPVVALTTGGPLLEVARRAELPHLAFPAGGQPRAAIGYSVGLLMGLLERGGYLALGDAEVASAADEAERAVAACAPERPTRDNVAKQLAWSLVDRMAVIEAAGALAPVARRWKTQLNENAKSMAAFEALPEATHNAVVGYAHPESAQERTFVVFLAARSDHPRNRLRAQLSAQLLEAAHVPHRTIEVAGEGPLAEALHGIVIGDATSVYLAALYGEDPTPIEALSGIKARLAAAADEATG
jgi:glucose/mannose-6-phosphate isomerase